jgi:hypothetical protein
VRYTHTRVKSAKSAEERALSMAELEAVLDEMERDGIVERVYDTNGVLEWRLIDA